MLDQQSFTVTITSPLQRLVDQAPAGATLCSRRETTYGNLVLAKDLSISGIDR